MTLEALFAKSNISTWNEGSWFKGAKLHGPLLTIPCDAAHLAFIEKHFAPKMREHISDLCIRQAPPARPSAEPRPGQHRAFKDEWYERQKQGDFL